jgi:site-specific recombinase XerD
MANELVSAKSGVLTAAGDAPGLPSLIVRAGDGAKRRYLEFFAAQIRNRNTREAYLRAVRDFLDWAETEARIEDLLDIEPLHVAAWVEIKTQTYEAQSVKQQLAALRHLFDWLVTGHVLHTNPASFVGGSKFSYTKGKTPILTPTEARKLIRSIPTDTLVGLRDRALIGLMIYTFARVSAAVTMNVKDVYRKQLGANRLHRQRAWAMVKRRAKKAGIDAPGICNHSFRGTGITAYLENPEAKLDHAQQMPRTRTRRPHGSSTAAATRSPSMRSSGLGSRAPRPGLAGNIFRSMAAGQIPPNCPRRLAIVDRAMTGPVPVEADIGRSDVELLPAVAAVPVAPLAEDLGELSHRTADLGRGLQLDAQEAGVERRVVDDHQGVADGLDDPRPKRFVRWRILDVRRCDAVDLLRPGQRRCRMGRTSVSSRRSVTSGAVLV